MHQATRRTASIATMYTVALCFLAVMAQDGHFAASTQTEAAHFDLPVSAEAGNTSVPAAMSVFAGHAVSDELQMPTF